MELNDSTIAFLRQKLLAYADFTAGRLNEIVRHFEFCIYRKNEYLLKEGEICDFWGFIQDGLVRSYSLKDNGEEHTIGCILEGSFISESLSFIKRIPSTVNIHALENTTLIFISFEKLQQLFLKYPDFESFARKLYEDRLASTKSRLLFRIQLNATDRYCYLLKIQPEIIKRVPLKHIASYLGITDSTLSRIRRKLSRMKPD
jgi:CRP-like cAMP-binding protein